MKPNSKQIEYRGFAGIDTRADQTLIKQPYLLQAKNCILEKGVVKSKPGVELWGTLDHGALAGTVYTTQGFDVGATEYILLHKGISLYYGTKDGSWVEILDLDGISVGVSDAESEMEAIGFDVGSTGKLSYKVLFKQNDGCKVLEFLGSSNTWIVRNTGIDTNFVTFALSSEAGVLSLEGTYRVRITAQRIIDDVRVNESAPLGTITGSTSDPPFYQEYEVPSGGGAIGITIQDIPPDAQTTHYGVQITRVLDMVGGTEYSQNGNDPTIYYESISIPVASIGVTTVIPTDVDTLKVVAPNFTGFKSIPGHLISTVTGNLLFFCGVAGNVNRIYNAGASGFYYHSELYDPYEFTSGGDDDGQLVVGMGKVQDHLLVIKEAKTGILPNRDISGDIVWRDYRLGIKNRNDFKNITEDEVIVFNQDKIFRVFDGIRYDRERSIGGQVYGFSENIRTKSEAIDSDGIDFIFQDERLHIIYDNSGQRDALIFHPRDDYGWTFWENCNITKPFLVGNGSEFIFGYDDKFYKQNTDSGVEVSGLVVAWEIAFALMTSQITQRNVILVKEVAVDGSFINDIKSLYTLDLGRVAGSDTDSVPKVSRGYGTPWYQLPARFQISGQYIKLTLKGWGDSTVKGVNWTFIEKRVGSPWLLASYTPSDFLLSGGDIIETGVETHDFIETGTETYDVIEGE